MSDERTSKRPRTDGAVIPRKRAHRSDGESRLFAPYRTVGLVSPSAVPFTAIPLGKTTFQITTSVGGALQTYDLARGLNLVFITRPQTPAPITATLAWKEYVFAAWGSSEADLGYGIWIFRRGKKAHELEIPHGQNQEVKRLCVFGSWIVGICNSAVLVWKSSTLEHYTTVSCMPGSAFTGAAATLPSLLNKLLLGKSDACVEIWNVSTGKLVHTMLPESTEVGSVSALEPAPALGVVAIGYQDGTVELRDVSQDEQIMTFSAGGASQGSCAVDSIAFRTDGLGAGDDGRKPGVMATASKQSGDITLWDLNQGGRKAGTLRGAHAAPSKGSSGGVTKIEFLPGQAILVSSGLDNHLCTWIFDETPFSPIPRPLHSRGGHGGPVTRLHFLPSASDGSDMSGKWLMAASRDRSLWGWSLRRDGQSSELSQGAIKKKARKSGIMASEGKDFIEGLKAPPVTHIACSLNRDGGMGATPGKLPIWQAPGQSKPQQRDAESSGMTGWESVVTAHENDSKARTWFWGRKRAGRWAFETSDKSTVSSVAVSACGTFAVIGSKKGGIDKFNLQSGIHRQRFPPRLTPQQAKQLKIQLIKDGEDIEFEQEPGQQHFYRGQGRHVTSVTGLAVDNLNQTLISCGQDGKVKFWDFRTGALRQELDWSIYGTSIAALRLHRSSELAAFSCSNGSIRVIDTTTRKLVRELRISKDVTNELRSASYSDFTFTADGRWMTAATSSFLAVWDLPTGHLIDLFRLPASITALSFSPTGEYLATASSNSVGIDIWTNRTLYTHVPTRHIGKAEVSTILSSTKPTNGPDTAGSTAPVNILTGPSSSSSASDNDLDLDLDLDLDPNLQHPDTDTDDLTTSLLSLSLVPRSKWQSLLHLDTIRARNAPVAPPTKPEEAPFFLGALAGATTSQGALPAAEAAEQRAEQDRAALDAERSRIVKMDRSSGASRTTVLLHRAVEEDSDGAWRAFVEEFKMLGPAAADVEIRSLARDNRGVNEFVAFVRALCWLLERRRDFELGQAWMSVFLRVHGDVVVQDGEVREVVGRWGQLLKGEKERVQALVEYCSGMVGYLRAARV